MYFLVEVSSMEDSITENGESKKSLLQSVQRIWAMSYVECSVLRFYAVSTGCARLCFSLSALVFPLSRLSR